MTFHLALPALLWASHHRPWSCLTLSWMLAACGAAAGGDGSVPTEFKRIVHQRVVPLSEGGTRHELYAVNEDGSAERVLAVSDDDESLEVEGYVGFASEPERSRVIYSRNNLAGRDLYSVNLDGTDTQILTSNPSIF